MHPHVTNVSFPALLRAQDVARVLNISRSLAYRLLDTGQIPTVRIGKAVRVKPQDLEEFINRSCTVCKQEIVQKETCRLGESGIRYLIGSHPLN